MRRVALLCFNRGGLYQYAVQLLDGLLAASDSTLLFLTSRANPESLLPSHPRLRVVRIDAPHRSLAFLRSLTVHPWNVAERALQSFNPDVVHIVDAYPWYLWWSPFSGRCPRVVTLHDPIPHSGERRRALLTYTLRRLVRNASCVVVHGEALRAATIAAYALPAEAVQSVPLAAYTLFRRWAKGAQADPRHLLFFGRLLPYKGLDVLGRAFELLRARGVDVKLTIAGEGQRADALRALPPSVRSAVALKLGYLREEEVTLLLEQHAVVVLPYREATQSAVVALAAALGRPVVASRVGALPEMVHHGETGLLVPPNDAGALADALQLLVCDDVLRERLGRQARAAADGPLSWPRIAVAYTHCYAAAVSAESSHVSHHLQRA